MNRSCPCRASACNTHCNMLQHIATHCNTLHHSAPRCTTLQRTLQRTLQHILSYLRHYWLFAAHVENIILEEAVVKCLKCQLDSELMCSKFIILIIMIVCSQCHENSVEDLILEEAVVRCLKCQLDSDLCVVNSLSLS